MKLSLLDYNIWANKFLCQSHMLFDSWQTNEQKWQLEPEIFYFRELNNKTLQVRVLLVQWWIV
jgi:hypothetical protein